MITRTASSFTWVASATACASLPLAPASWPLPTGSSCGRAWPSRRRTSRGRACRRAAGEVLELLVERGQCVGDDRSHLLPVALQPGTKLRQRLGQRLDALGELGGRLRHGRDLTLGEALRARVFAGVPTGRHIGLWPAEHRHRRSPFGKSLPNRVGARHMTRTACRCRHVRHPAATECDSPTARPGAAPPRWPAGRHVPRRAAWRSRGPRSAAAGRSCLGPGFGFKNGFAQHLGLDRVGEVAGRVRAVVQVLQLLRCGPALGGKLHRRGAA